jgi:hypothetical protein
MTEIQTRAQWNARPWTTFQPLDWSRVDKFIVHYSGAVRTQTVRSIQDYCMDSKGHSDIDYNELERDGVVYEGRMDHVGGHTLNLNSTSYAICMIGLDGDATDADRRAIRERYEYACGRAGRKLTMYGHRTAPFNVGTTDCPGDELQQWINQGMPWPGGVPSDGGDDLRRLNGDGGAAVRGLRRQLRRQHGGGSRRTRRRRRLHLRAVAASRAAGETSEANDRYTWPGGSRGSSR